MHTLNYNVLSCQPKTLLIYSTSLFLKQVQNNRKMVCVDVHDIPVVAGGDPGMMSTMPKGLTNLTPAILIYDLTKVSDIG